jgi:hypothetical protein
MDKQQTTLEDSLKLPRRTKKAERLKPPPLLAPFEPGDNRKVAVKIVDDRGIESLKIIPLED